MTFGLKVLLFEFWMTPGKKDAFCSIFCLFYSYYFRFENNETFTLTLNPILGSLENIQLNPNTFTVTIVDNDSEFVSFAK